MCLRKRARKATEKEKEGEKRARSRATTIFGVTDTRFLRNVTTDSRDVHKSLLITFPQKHVFFIRRKQDVPFGATLDRDICYKYFVGTFRSLSIVDKSKNEIYKRRNTETAI